MAHHVFVGSTSSSLTDSKRELGSIHTHVKWESMKTFLYIAGIFSSSGLNFSTFSGIVDSVPIWLHLFFLVSVGIPYMSMDVFIKQYTGRIDLNENLIPLLKAVNYAIMLQSGVWTLINACDLSEAMLHLIACMIGIPPWLDCRSAELDGETCISMLNISVACRKSKFKIPEKVGSNYIHYRKMFLLGDRSVVTRRIFVIALVWVINFFITTLSEPMLVKFFKLAFVFRASLSTFFILFVGLSTYEHLLPAFKMMIDSQKDFEIVASLGYVMYPFGVGLVGVYDFGAMSPFAMVDTIVVVFAVLFVSLIFLMSLMMRVLYDLVSKCIDYKEVMHYHYLLMAIVPVGSMFIKLQRLVMILVYLMMITTLLPHNAAITFTVAKILHNEFHSVKNVYFTGLLSFFGCLLTSILALYIHFPWFTRGVQKALFTCMALLAFKRISIIMYIYGVQKFSSDIHFWLGFKPAIYWIVAWSLMPAILFYCVTAAFLQLIAPLNGTSSLYWRLWVGFSILIVLISMIKTIARYASRNKLSAVLRPSHKYGPPDADERKRRKRYDESVTLRQCVHNCMPLDNIFDCNHVPRPYKKNVEGDNLRQESDVSINPIFEAESVRKLRESEVFDAQQLRD